MKRATSAMTPYTEASICRRELLRRGGALIGVALVAGACGSGPTGSGGADEVTATDSNDTRAMSAPTPQPATDTASQPPTPEVDEALPPPTAEPTAQPTVGAAAEATPVPAQPAPTATPIVLPTGITPRRLVIDAIGVDAVVIDLDLRGAEPEVPENFAETGWYTQTRLPGELGPAVIAGHIDSRTGPAVFHRLDELAVGDEIHVESATGERRSFRVVGSGQYAKVALPPEVFGVSGSTSDLRLITCGGTFDASSGHYRDNYVVYSQRIET